MKMQGVNLDTPVEEILVLPRGEQIVVFKARPVLDMDTFDKLCPEPQAPTRTMRGGAAVPNLDDKGYIRDLQTYAEKRMAYLVIRSLEATEGLEWEQVKLNDSSTWLMFRKELGDANFSAMEIGRIVNTVLAANCLDEAKLEKARQVFLRGQRTEPEKSTGLSTELANTSSGKPVPALA